jgi:hypothetical protein
MPTSKACAWGDKSDDDEVVDVKGGANPTSQDDYPALGSSEPGLECSFSGAIAPDGRIAMPSIWRLSHRRALKECGERLELSLGRIMTGALIAAIYLFLVWNFIGVKESQQEFQLKLAWSIAPLLGLPLYYAVHFFRSPTKIYNEAQEKIQELFERLDKKPRLRLSYAQDKTQPRGIDGSKLTFLYAINDKGGDVSGVQVKIEEAVLRRDGSDKWDGTSIVARTNMSWGHLDDDDPQKYSTSQLAPGSDVIDFISGPLIAKFGSGQEILGFKIRISPKHRIVIPFFWEKGTYRFMMQISAADTENPGKLTLFADWNGATLVIRSDDQVLETAEILKA